MKKLASLLTDYEFVSTYGHANRVGPFGKTKSSFLLAMRVEDFYICCKSVKRVFQSKIFLLNFLSNKFGRPDD